MDDGSTDGTSNLVEKYRREGNLNIEYYYHTNRHKYITVFEGIKKVKTSYFMILDSDDSWPEDSLEFLFEEVSKIEDQKNYIGVMGNSADEEGNLVGTAYPKDVFDGSIFDMRYKYKVRGDKFGIFITETYHKWLNGYDYSLYEGKGYIPQSVFFNQYDSKGIKTRFINKVVRYYHKDEDDNQSVSNTRWTGKNVFGLAEGYKSLVNNYSSKLFSFPIPLLRNMAGYLLYSSKDKRSYNTVIKEVNPFWAKTLAIVLYPIISILKK